jgi:hypothetical protein
MSGDYEHYSAPCPRCGYPEARDDGPYPPDPASDAAFGGPPDPEVHLLWCGRCGKPFDVGPDGRYVTTVAFMRSPPPLDKDGYAIVNIPPAFRKPPHSHGPGAA